VTQEGNSVLAHIHGFKPYFYVAAPPGFLNNDLDSLKDTINVSVGFGESNEQSHVPAAVAPVTNCIILNRKSLWGYRGDENVPFIKITCYDHKSLSRVKDKSTLLSRADQARAFERSQINYNDLFPPEIMTFESNLAYTLRFMIDTKVVGMNWVELKAGKYQVLEGKDKRSLCQIEANCQ
jgi:DNA polymerase delta subunit 1